LTFPKAVVIILKHATSLRHSMLPGPALVQANLDYQRAGIHKKIQQHVVVSKGHSAELDRAFIMAIQMVRHFLCLLKSYEAFISNFRCDKFVCILRGSISGTGILTYDTVMSMQRQCRLICVVEQYVMFLVFELLLA